MPRITIRSIVGEPVTVSIDGTDITDMVLADPCPTVRVASGNELGKSLVTLTLMGDLDLEVDGEVDRADAR